MRRDTFPTDAHYVPLSDSRNQFVDFIGISGEGSRGDNVDSRGVESVPDVFRAGFVVLETIGDVRSGESEVANGDASEVLSGRFGEGWAVCLFSSHAQRTTLSLRLATGYILAGSCAQATRLPPRRSSCRSAGSNRCSAASPEVSHWSVPHSSIVHEGREKAQLRLES